MNDGWINAICIWRNTVRINRTPRRSQFRNWIVGWGVCYDAHGDEDGKKSQPDGEISEPTIGFQSSNLSEEKTDYDKQDGADNVAKLEHRHLRDILAVLDGDLAQDEQETECLNDVGYVSSRSAPCSEAKISIVSCWKFVAVDAEEDVPDQVARISCHKTKDCIESNT